METTNTLSRYDLPQALRTFWDTAPEKFRIAAVITAATCYCALATRIRARYVYDLDEHALLLQVIVVGEAGSGKSFTRTIVRQIMQPLKLMDYRNRRVETEYAEKKRRLAKNKDLPPEPLTSVRCLQTITKAKLVKRADMFERLYHEPLAFWFFNEELATMTDSNKRAFADLNTMDRLAYDIGALYGSDALSDASYNAEVDIIYCSLFCSTGNALNEYIGRTAIEGGNCTRKVVVRLDDEEIGEDAPLFTRQTDEQRTLVEDTAQRLMDETYTPDGNGIRPQMHLDMQWMDDCVRQWCDQQRVRVAKSGSRALNCFYKRASVSAWRMAVMAYHLWCGELGVSDLAYEHFGQPDGQPTLFGDDQRTADDNEEECRRRMGKAQVHTARFYRYMADYILQGLMRQWGQRYEDLQRETEEERTADRRTLFDQLPPRFTRDQLRLLITQNRLNTPERVFISKWKRMRLIRLEKTDPEIFAKHDAPEDDGTTPAGGSPTDGTPEGGSPEGGDDTGRAGFQYLPSCGKSISHDSLSTDRAGIEDLPSPYFSPQDGFPTVQPGTVSEEKPAKDGISKGKRQESTTVTNKHTYMENFFENYKIGILRRLPIEQVAARLGIEVRRHKAICPFHDDHHPSLSFNRRNNTFRCFVCGTHGSTIDLAMRMLNTDFREACQWIAKEYGIFLTPQHHPNPRPWPRSTPPWARRTATPRPADSRTAQPHPRDATPPDGLQPRPAAPPPTTGSTRTETSVDTEYLETLLRCPTLNDEARRFLFDERHYKPEVVARLGITSISQPTACRRFGHPYYDAPALLFPYRDRRGKLVSVQSRYLGHDDRPRFRFPPGSRHGLFNLDIVDTMKPGEPLYIAEGITDCIALLCTGRKAIAVPSATTLRPEDLAGLPTDWHIYPDRDKAGEQLYQMLLEAANKLGACLTRHSLPTDCKDFSDFYASKLTTKGDE